MIFLYSRKLQLVLLLFWCIGVTVLYIHTTGERPLWLAKASERIVQRDQKARIGQTPELPAPESPPAPVPAPVKQPEADPVLNRCLAMRVDQNAGDHADMLTVELDYVAAREKGFTVEKAYSYYLEDAPTFVVELGEPWTSDVGNAPVPGTVPQATHLNLIVSKSRHLRLLVHTPSMRVAKNAKLAASPTETGIRMEIQLPR